MKPLPGKGRQSVENYLNGNRKLLRRWFSSYLELKNVSPEDLKRAFSVFGKYLSDKVKTIFWGREAKRSKLFKSKLDQRKFLRKLF